MQAIVLTLLATLNINAESVRSSDTLPLVLPLNRADLLESRLRNEAAIKYACHQLPVSLEEWQAERKLLRDEIIRKTGVIFKQRSISPGHYWMGRYFNGCCSLPCRCGVH